MSKLVLQWNPCFKAYCQANSGSGLHETKTLRLLRLLDYGWKLWKIIQLYMRHRNWKIKCKFFIMSWSTDYCILVFESLAYLLTNILQPNAENRSINPTYIFHRIIEPFWYKLAVRENKALCALPSCYKQQIARVKRHCTVHRVN